MSSLDSEKTIESSIYENQLLEKDDGKSRHFKYDGENLDIGKVLSIQENGIDVDVARKGDQVCIQIVGSHKYTYGKQFDSSDLLISHLTRSSLDILKTHFRDEIRECRLVPLLKELKTIYKIA